jgi:hypothetical protein
MTAMDAKVTRRTTPFVRDGPGVLGVPGGACVFLLSFRNLHIKTGALARPRLICC